MRLKPKYVAPKGIRYYAYKGTYRSYEILHTSGADKTGLTIQPCYYTPQDILWEDKQYILFRLPKCVDPMHCVLYYRNDLEIVDVGD